MSISPAALRYRVEFLSNGVTRVRGVEKLLIKPTLPRGAELILLDHGSTHICEALSVAGIDRSGVWAGAVSADGESALDVVAWQV